jgi:uncharacterized DUF497 family protein
MAWHIEGFIWLEWVIEKIYSKHNINPEEVEEVFFNIPYQLLRADEGKYKWLGRTDNGRYLVVILVRQGNYIKVITARDMNDAERRLYARSR